MARDAAQLHKLYGLVVAAPAKLPAPATSGPIDVYITESTKPLFDQPIPHPDSPFGYRVTAHAVEMEWGDFQFALPPDGLSIRFYAGRADPHIVFEYLVPQLLSVSLLQRNIDSLHAIAMEKSGRAIAIVGGSAYGKSTLAAALLQLKWRLLTDDLLVLADDLVLPGAQRIKLTPDSAALFLSGRAGIAMTVEQQKSVFALSDEEFCAQPTRLERLYVLRPYADSPAVSALTEAEAFRALAAATFNPLDVSQERLARHIRFVKSIVDNATVLSIHVPATLDAVPACARLIDDAQ